MTDTLVSSFSSATCVVMQKMFSYARAYACHVVLYARVHTAITQIPVSYARHATDSNSVYCSPFAVTFLTYFHFLTFPNDTPNGTRARTERRHPPENIEKRTRRRDESWEIRKSLAISRRRLSRESGRSRIFGFSKMFHHNSHCFRHKNVKMAFSRNDDVSNFALYILTDVTLLS